MYSCHACQLVVVCSDCDVIKRIIIIINPDLGSNIHGKNILGNNGHRKNAHGKNVH